MGNKQLEHVTRWQTSPQLWDKLKPLARQKRLEPTPAEDHLWTYLRNRQVLGYKFRRQHSIAKFIVDFYSIEGHLAIEVDGPIHEYTREEDALRQTFLESLGNRVLRLTNEAVLNSPDSVIEQIRAYLFQQTLAGPSTDESPLSESVGAGGEVRQCPQWTASP